MSKWFDSAFGSALDDLFLKVIVEGWSGRHQLPPDRSHNQQKVIEPDTESARPNPWDLDRGIDR
jgi:hypothetical protein